MLELLPVYSITENRIRLEWCHVSSELMGRCVKPTNALGIVSDNCHMV